MRSGNRSRSKNFGREQALAISGLPAPEESENSEKEAGFRMFRPAGFPTEIDRSPATRSHRKGGPAPGSISADAKVVADFLQLLGETGIGFEFFRNFPAGVDHRAVILAIEIGPNAGIVNLCDLPGEVHCRLTGQ